MRIRRATERDVPTLLEIKAGLRFDTPGAASTTGGFLLGTDAAGYLARIRHARTWVLEDDAVAGFAIVLPDPVFRASDVWARRDAVAWEIDPSAFDGGRLGYFDQLAVARGRHAARRWGAALALKALHALFAEGHDHVVTTTVSEPVLNLAAVPYLLRLGARRVGRIDEEYPEFGPLVSDVWLLDRADFDARLAAPRGLAERWVCDAAVPG